MLSVGVPVGALIVMFPVRVPTLKILYALMSGVIDGRMLPLSPEAHQIQIHHRRQHRMVRSLGSQQLDPPY